MRDTTADPTVVLCASCTDEVDYGIVTSLAKSLGMEPEVHRMIQARRNADRFDVGGDAHAIRALLGYKLGIQRWATSPWDG